MFIFCLSHIYINSRSYLNPWALSTKSNHRKLDQDATSTKYVRKKSNLQELEITQFGNNTLTTVNKSNHSSDISRLMDESYSHCLGPISCPHIVSTVSWFSKAKAKSFLLTFLASITEGLISRTCFLLKSSKIHLH